MKNHGLYFSLFSSICLNSFALAIHNGKILSDREWTVGAIRGHYRDVALAHPANKNTYGPMDSILLANRVIDGKGDTVNQTPVEAYGEIYIENATNQPQTYTINSGFCVETDDLCLMRNLTIELDPNGYIDISRFVTADYQFKTVGEYRTQFTTSIMRPNGSTHFGTHAVGTTTIS